MSRLLPGTSKFNGEGEFQKRSETRRCPVGLKFIDIGQFRTGKCKKEPQIFLNHLNHVRLRQLFHRLYGLIRSSTVAILTRILALEIKFLKPIFQIAL